MFGLSPKVNLKLLYKLIISYKYIFNGLIFLSKIESEDIWI